MLDKRTTRFLLILAKICSDGSYKIIEKQDLAKDFTDVDQMIRYLQDNEMIDLKYSDETVYCLSVLPKGRVVYEGARQKVRIATKIERKTLILIVAFTFVASLLGSLFGALIAGLF